MTTPGPDVFLSYSREDQATARRYAQSLKQEGFSVWWDQTLRTGENYDRVTEAALREAKAVLVLWSRASVDSQWVRAEATSADRRGTLMPAMIEPCERPIMFELKHTAELSHWNGEKKDRAWQAFIADLRQLVQRGEQSETSTPPASTAAPVVATTAPNTGPRRGRMVAIAAAVAVLIVAVAIGAFSLQRAAKVKQAREAVSAIAALVEAGDYPAAFARAQEVRRIIPDDSLLRSLTPLFTTTYAVTSTPSDAEVFVRGYEAAEDTWQSIGRTPLARVDLPRRAMRWRFEKAGYQAVERANSALGYSNGFREAYLVRDASKLDVTLRPVDEGTSGMVYVTGGLTANALGSLRQVELPPFLIDRHEVTNAAFKEFVDAGGYERPSWWEFDIKQNGKLLTLAEAMRLFVDATGRPGPATWELGKYPEGQADFPVAGVSWYEAAAYARFRGKSLPTPYHWAKAAFLQDEVASSLAASAAPLSNFGTTAAAAVGQYQGVGPYGTYDLFGNVREWVVNTGSRGGWVIGGSWEDPWYSYANAASVALLERSAINGFRLVQDLSEPANGPALRAAIDLENRGRPGLASQKPVSDDAFATLQSQLAYRPGPLNATAVTTMATTEDWIKQRVTIDTGYNGERMDVILFVPQRARPPFQPVIFISGLATFVFPATVDSIGPGYAAMPLDYIVKSGRMLVQPVLQGTYERLKTRLSLDDQVRLTRNLVEWRWDLGRTIDYLATRPDVDATRVGFIGLSFGASVTVPLLAVEPRLRAAVFLSGGIESLERTPFLDVVNYAPRIQIPVLMVNGRYDEIFPVETSQVPLFKLFGSPPADKRHVILESGHGSPPRAEVLRETLGWYDKYLGEVRQ